MPPIAKQDQAINALTVETAQDIRIARKNIIVEAQRLNTGIVYLAYSQDENRPAMDNFEPFGPNEAKFYSAEKGKKIWHLWVYATVATQYINYTASDGAIARPLSHDFSEYATIANVVEGFNFVERWEQGFDKRKYFGRLGAYFKTEAALLDRNRWTAPPLVAAVNTVQVSPWNNAIWMRNSIDGSTLDELYLTIPQAFKRARVRFDGKLPTLAQLGANDIVAVGFELNSQGGHAAPAYLIGQNGTYTIQSVQAPIGGVTPVSPVDVSATITKNAWCEWLLEYDFPWVRLFEYSGGAWSQLGELGPIVAKSYGPMYAIPFFCNESATIVSNFYLGNIAVNAFADPINNTVGRCAAIASTNAWASALKFRNLTRNRCLIGMWENATHDIQYKVLGSMDDAVYFTLVAATDLLTGGSAAVVTNDPWQWIDVQIIDKVGGTHGSFYATAGGHQ